jgi:hypothetical protein
LLICPGISAVLAQLDRASGFEPEGRGFESLTPHHKPTSFRGGRFVFELALSGAILQANIPMSVLLLIGLVLAGVPAGLIIGFAAWIFLGFVNDDKDAKAVFTLAMIMMGIGVALILAHFAGTLIQVTP